MSSNITVFIRLRLPPKRRPRSWCRFPAVQPLRIPKFNAFGTRAWRDPPANAVKLPVACRALQMPAANPQAIESAQAFMARVTRTDAGVCPCCQAGQLRCAPSLCWRGLGDCLDQPAPWCLTAGGRHERVACRDQWTRGTNTCRPSVQCWTLSPPRAPNTT